jgi:hypothetical protein
MQIRVFVLLIIFVGLNWHEPCFPQKADSSELLKTADEMVKTVTRLRGLKPKAPILKGVKTRDEISKYLNERVEAEYDQGELAREGKVLRILGLIPPAMDYREFIMKLLTEQVGGFYDPEDKTFYIASWLPAEEQKPVMVHELTHALQDQYFDMKKILNEDRELDNDDRTLAHQAIFEGDGMAVMLDFLLEPVNRNFAQLPDLAFIMQTQMSTMQSQFAVFEEAPPFLQENLLFPYGYGASFIQKAWIKEPSWDSVNRIYSDLPASTEQILHPEKYFDERDDPKSLDVENPAAGLDGNWKIAYKNVLGEFSLDLLLRLHLPEERARRSAAGWGGDLVLLLENDDGENAVFVTTVWDTLEASDRFFQAMDEWFQKRFPETLRLDESPEGFSVIQGKKFYAIRHEGETVRFVLGFPEATGQNLKEF